MAAMPVSHDEKEQGLLNDTPEEENGSRQAISLEEQLEAVLSASEGVGEVRVMLMTGNGENSGFYGTEDTEVTGVLIAAQGADDPVTVRNIQQAVMALFQIEAHKIKIMKMK